MNVLVGENGTGKTHLLKLLYSAITSANGRVSFANKLVRTMLPMQLKISRLINRDNDKDGCRGVVKAENANIELDFNKDTTSIPDLTAGYGSPRVIIEMCRR